MNNEPIHDPTITLRLELGRVTDQRDAFKAALHNDVLAVIRNATQNPDIIGCLQVELDDLKAENARIKDDLQMEKENEDRLVRNWQQANNEVHGLKSQVAALIDEQTRLKAQVERLNTGIQPEGCNDAVGRAVELLLEKEKENARLKAEVEELQRLLTAATFYKEGKQP